MALGPWKPPHCGGFFSCVLSSGLLRPIIALSPLSLGNWQSFLGFFLRHFYELQFSLHIVDKKIDFKYTVLVCMVDKGCDTAITQRVLLPLRVMDANLK